LSNGTYAGRPALDPELTPGRLECRWVPSPCSRLQPNDTAFGVKALQCGFGAMNQRHHNFPLAGSLGSLNKNIITADDVLVAHGIASDLERKTSRLPTTSCSEMLSGNSDVSTGSPAAIWPASGRRSLERVRAPGGSTSMERLRLWTRSRSPFFSRFVMCFVDGCQALEPHSSGNLLKRRGIPVACHKGSEEIDHFFLSASNSHGRIIANKKRIAPEVFLKSSFLFAGNWGGNFMIEKSK